MSHIDAPDIDPVKGPIPRLVGIIQKLNTTLESTQTCLQREQERVREETDRYQEIVRRYTDLQSKYLCADCQRHLRTTTKGDTICFCGTCNDTKDTVVELRSELQRLKEELERCKRQ